GSPFASNGGDPRTAGSVYFLTNPIDITGLTLLTFVLVGNVTAAGGDTTDVTWSFYAVPQITDPVTGWVISIIPNLPGLSNENMTGDYARSAFPLLGTMVLKTLKNVGPYPYRRMASTGIPLDGRHLSGPDNSPGTGPIRVLALAVVGQ